MDRYCLMFKALLDGGVTQTVELRMLKHDATPI